MLHSLKINSFKSLREVDVKFGPFTVLLGPNAAGKSNIIDAILALSRLAAERTVADALAPPLRGLPLEAFSFPPDGLAGLLDQESAEFSLSAEFDADGERYRYAVTVGIRPDSGTLSVLAEDLSALNKRSGEPKGAPRLQTKDGEVFVRESAGRPRQELLTNHTKLSDPRLAGVIEKCRQELSGWRTYYVDPRVSMRRQQPPMDVDDIGVLGENIAPFLYRLKAEHFKSFNAIKRAVTSIISSVENIEVDLDKRRGVIDVLVQQSGTAYSSRIVSEGTLRVIALCAIAVNPWGGTLVAFEEPENGVHPRRIELIAKVLASMAEQKKQIIVTTHSPLFCKAALSERDSEDKGVSLITVRSGLNGTETELFDPTPLFEDRDVRAALSAQSEDALFENALIRGLLNA